MNVKAIRNDERAISNQSKPKVTEKIQGAYERNVFICEYIL